MSEIQRFRLNVDGRPKAKNQWVAEQPHKKGGWCKYSEVKDLERQLAEAREVIKDAIIQLGYYSACGGTQATEFLDRNKDLIDQLKEQGL